MLNTEAMLEYPQKYKISQIKTLLYGEIQNAYISIVLLFFLLCKSYLAFIYRHIYFLAKPSRFLIACIWKLYFDKKIKYAIFQKQTRMQNSFHNILRAFSKRIMK